MQLHGRTPRHGEGALVRLAGLPELQVQVLLEMKPFQRHRKKSVASGSYNVLRAHMTIAILLLLELLLITVIL